MSMNRLSLLLLVALVSLHINAEADTIDFGGGSISDTRFNGDDIYLGLGSHLYYYAPAEVSSIRALNSSFIHFNSGTTNYIETHNYSETLISDGEIGRFSLLGNSLLEIHGGQIYSLTTHDDSRVRYSAGSFNYAILYDNSSLSFYGTNFSIGDPEDDGRGTWYSISGELEDGVEFSTTFATKNDSFSGAVYLNDSPYHFNSDAIGDAPVPEPATMLLFGTGLVGLARVAKRKKR